MHSTPNDMNPAARPTNSAATDPQLNANLERERAEATARQQQVQPGSPEYNPGGGEYREGLVPGPAGTEHAVGPSRAEADRHGKPLGNAPAQHDVRDELAADAGQLPRSRPADFTPDRP